MANAILTAELVTVVFKHVSDELCQHCSGILNAAARRPAAA